MAQATHCTQVQLFLYQEDSGQYQEYGTVGCAIMGTPGTYATYKLGCYNDGGEYLCTCPIGASNDSSIQFALQGNGYTNVRDDQGRLWSLLFPDETSAQEFGAHLSIAMFGASNQPTANILCCDVAQGKKDKTVYSNDKVKVRYTSWVVQRGAGTTELPKLGSRLESNEQEEKPYMFVVPPNHNSVSKEMKGFEGMSVGMAEEAQRFIVVPSGAKRGSGPSVDMCYHIKIIRKKENDGKDASPTTAPMQQQQQSMQQQPVGGYQPQQQFVDPLQQQPGPMTGQLVPAAPVVAAAPVASNALVVAAPEVAAPPVVTAPAPPPPPPGFSSEQLDVIDRMRDQMTKLQLQLKDTMNRVDMFSHDFRQNDQKQKPTSLASAQLEHTIKTMLHETEEMKDELGKRDETLKMMEEKNKQLQSRVDKFSATAAQLADEKKSAISSSHESKIEADRQVLSLQTQLTRIQGEREDCTRHLSTVKRLLEVSDQDTKAEKGKLQVAEVNHSTLESKIANMTEGLNEERSRRKILEGKAVTLAEELRTAQEEVRTKEAEIEEKRRKIDANKMHWNDMMEQERDQAATELREIRQELVEELALRDARYSSERQRVAAESFERGKVAGIDDGYHDATMEADSKVQTLTLEAQRSRSEVETMRIKLRQITETSDSDKRRLEAQIAALTRTVDDLTGQNNATDIELESLSTALGTATESAFEKLVALVRGLSRDVGKKDLLNLLHLLRSKKPLDYSYESKREEEEGHREDLEREEVLDWVREALHSDTAVGPAPPMRTKAAEEKALPAPGLEESSAAKAEEPLPELLPVTGGEEINMDLDAVQQRYNEIMRELSDRDPSLGLLPPKPPTPEPEPPREPTPEPPREPTPEPPREPTPEPPREPTPEVASEEPAEQPSPAEQRLEQGDESDYISTPFNSPAEGFSQPPPKPAAAPAEEDTDEDIPMPGASAPVAAQEEEKEAPAAAPPTQEEKPTPSSSFAVEDDEEEEEPVSAPPPKSQPKKSMPAPKNNAFDDTDEDEEEAAAPPPKKAIPAPKKVVGKRAAPTSSLFADSDDSEEDVAPAPVTAAAKRSMNRQSTQPATKASRPTSMFDDSDDSDDAPPARPPAKVSTKKSMARPKVSARASLFDDSDDSD